jgi:hypothetical protein
MRGKTCDPLISHSDLLRLLRYEPKTGQFYWIERAQGRQMSKPAGSRHAEGYWMLTIRGQACLAHRAAWFYMTGEWPVQQVDHRNTIGTDNRWDNLRPASHHQNQHNRQRPHKNNKLGLLGVYEYGGKFHAAIQVDGVKRRLGDFDEPSKASDAYWAAKAQLHPFSVSLTLPNPP